MEERNYIVYKHTSPSNKVYIGITKQTLKARWKNGKGYKNNEHFTYAIKKYGEENFKHEILFDNLTLEEAKIKEIETIALYDSTNRNKGYNKTIGGDPCNKGLTEKQKKQKRKEYDKEYNKRNIEKIREYSRKYEKTHREERRASANRRNKTEKRRKHRTEYMRKYRELNRDKIRKINQKSWRKKHPNPYKGKGVLVYDKNNNFICEFNSIKETAKELNYSVNSVSCFLRNKKNCIKYNFKYKENKNE